MKKVPTPTRRAPRRARRSPSAAGLRQQQRPVVFVPIPGDPEGAAVECRIPDLPTLLFNDWLPLPLLSAVVEAYKHLDEEQVDWIIEEEARDDESRFAEMLDHWVVATVQAPTIVLTRAQESDTAVCVIDLNVDLKLAVFRATYPAMVERVLAAGGAAAAATFRRAVGSRAAARSHGTPVWTKAITGLGPHGSLPGGGL